MPVDVSHWDGWTALDLATLLNRTGVIKRLLHEGADVNRKSKSRGNTPLHMAAQFNNIEDVRLLLDYGADTNLKNDNNKTPLDEARKGSKIESLLLQLQQSAP